MNLKISMINPIVEKELRPRIRILETLMAKSHKIREISKLML